MISPFNSFLPLVTLFIPTYKRPLLLKEALQSALNQTYEKIKIVVCDNASGDETAQVVASFSDPRIHYICHSNNKGMMGNYQFALSIVDTPFFSFLSDDDLLLPDFCETALNGFADHPQIAFFASSTTIRSKEKKIIREPVQLWSRDGYFEPQEGLCEMIGKFPVPTTVLFSQKALSAQIDTQNPVAWDCDFFIQLASRFPFLICKKTCGIMMQHDTSFTTHLDCQTTLLSIQRLIERAKQFSWIEKELKRSLIQALQIYSIPLRLLSGQKKEVRKICWEELLNHPLKGKMVLYGLASFFPFFQSAIHFLKRVRQFIFNRLR